MLGIKYFVPCSVRTNRKSLLFSVNSLVVVPVLFHPETFRLTIYLSNFLNRVVFT